jgi:DegV family protein with EDD domain
VGGIALVTDSTCDLREAERVKHVTAVLPLHVWFGGNSYLDRVDFDSAQFFQLFREAGQAAQSSQPSVGEFMNLYRDLLKEYESVISVHLAARLSGTVQTATMAAEAVDPLRIRIVDSRKVSVGVGLVVQAVGEAIAAGQTFDKVVTAAETAADRTRVYGALPSLEVAVRGGRTSARTARFAGLVKLKPLIVFDDEGAVHTDGATLGYSRAMRAVAEKVAHFADGRPVRLAIAHADGLRDAQYVQQRCQKLLGDLDIPIVEAGAVITTHVGLGTVAIAAQLTGDGVSGTSGG